MNVRTGGLEPAARPPATAIPTHSMNEIWCNGRFLPADRHPGAAQDRGGFLGLGLFETMLAVRGRVVFWDRHQVRLRQSCARLGWQVEIPDFAEIAAELLARNDLAERARLRLVVTAGSGPHNDLAPGADRLIWLAAFPQPDTAAPISVTISPWPRNERSPLAGLKTACYAENLIALDHARRGGFDETIFLNTAGQLCEAATANVFLVRDGRVLTPPLNSGCLPGVGREILLEIAGAEEIPLTAADLRDADEIFLTSATRGPVIVNRLEGDPLPPGPVAAGLRERWAELTAG